MNKKQLVEVLKKHGYATCKKCNEPILDKRNRVRIIREILHDVRTQRELLESYHILCYSPTTGSTNQGGK